MKKIKILRRLVSLLLVTAITLCLPGASASAAGRIMFSGRLYADGISDISGITLNVYRSSLVFDNDYFQRYDHKYLFSVTTGKNGSFSFQRPSGTFVVTADMSTLPLYTGITENMWVVADRGVSSVSAQVKKISGLDLLSENAESGEFKVCVTAADSTEIFCGYTAEVTDTSVTETADPLTGKRTFRTDRTVTITANGVVKTQVLTSETTETAIPVVSLQKPEFEYPALYTEAGGFFNIHYDKYQYSRQTVMNVYGTLKDAKAFYDKFGFKEPILESGCDKYNVYLVTKGVASATTRHVKNGSGYTVFQTPTNYNRQQHVFATSIIAHELFHAIMNAYTRAYGVLPSKWFREAFANWAGVMFIGYSSDTPTTYVNIFQSNPELSLLDTYDSRVYGALIFAQCIYENFGGMDTVKKIMEEFRNIGSDVKLPEIAAMDAVLQRTNNGCTFRKAFVRFTLNNMYPKLFYKLRGSDRWNDAERCVPEISDDCPLRDLECQPLSAKYFDVSPKKGTESAYVTITDNEGEYSGIAVCCVIKKPGGRHTYFYDTVKSFCTYRIKDLSALKNPGFSFGIVNTAGDFLHEISARVTYY